jgi:hypothetical protein
LGMVAALPHSHSPFLSPPHHSHCAPFHASKLTLSLQSGSVALKQLL